jgi:hypothetical protein
MPWTVNRVLPTVLMTAEVVSGHQQLTLPSNRGGAAGTRARPAARARSLMQLSARSNALVIVLCVCSRTEQSGHLSVGSAEMVKAMIAEREKQRVSAASGALPHPTS